VGLTWERKYAWDVDDWRQEAECRSSDAGLFFPIGSTGMAIEQVTLAKNVCETCAVKQSCLEFALHTNQEAGVWGGLAEDERRRVRRAWMAERRQRAAALT